MKYLIFLIVLFFSVKAFANPSKSKVTELLNSIRCQQLLNGNDIRPPAMSEADVVAITSSLDSIEIKLKQVRNRDFVLFASQYIREIRSLYLNPLSQPLEFFEYKKYFLQMADHLQKSFEDHPDFMRHDSIDMLLQDVTVFVHRTIVMLRDYAREENTLTNANVNRVVLDYLFSISLTLGAHWADSGYYYATNINSYIVSDAAEGLERSLSHYPLLLVLPSFEFADQTLSFDGLAAGYVFPITVTGVKEKLVDYDGMAGVGPLQYYQHDLRNHGLAFLNSFWRTFFFDNQTIENGKTFPIEFIESAPKLLSEINRRLDTYLAIEKVELDFENKNEATKAELVRFLHFITYHEELLEDYNISALREFWTNWDSKVRYPGPQLPDLLQQRLDSNYDLAKGFPLVRALYAGRANFNRVLSETLDVLVSSNDKHKYF